MSIQEGDLVIIYSSRQQIDSVIVKSGTEFQSRYGHFKHADMIGVAFGSKFASSNGRGFVYLLKPTPELWTLALPHRTQILYQPDIAFITSYLDIKAGSKVVEAGTGSGSFSHSIARSVGPQGNVHSFEFHEERYNKAREEFTSHGLDDVIQLKHRNVCKDGFELVNEVDSVFLDVPAPWEAVGHAKTALRKDRQARICCFSPCIEQVLRTVSALSELGYSDITMYEALTRSHEPAHLIAPDVSSAIERIQGVEAKKERRREGQIAEAAKKRMDKKRKQAAEEEANDEGGDAKKAKLDGGAPNEQEEGAVGEEDTAMEDVTAATSAAPTTNGSTPVDSPAPSAPVEESTPAPPTTSNRENKRTQKAEKEKEDRAALPPKLWTFKAGAQTRGHTSYLTFATLLPQSEAPVTTATTATETEKALPAAATVTMPVADAVDGEDEYAMDEADVRALLEVDLTQLPGTAVSKES